VKTIFMVEFKSKIENFNGTIALWTWHFVVPDIYVQEFKVNKINRLICNLDDKLDFNCALTPKGDGVYFIIVNAQIRKKLGLVLGSEIEVILKPDKSKYGMPMPEEMQEILNQDEEVNKYFHELTKGAQRSLLYLIGKPKTSETRLKKAILITRYLKLAKGNLDFKEMNAFMKESRL